MRTLSLIVIGILLVCYPFIVYFGALHFSPRYLALGIICLLLLRFLIEKKQTKITLKLPALLIVLTGIGVCILGFVSNSIIMLKLYPVFINLTLLSIFVYSVLNPPTIIELLARLREPNLPTKAIIYTRNVTLVWCVFFTINAVIALWTVCFSSTKTWAFYNGFLSYIFIGLLFSCEYVVRLFVKRKISHG